MKVLNMKAMVYILMVLSLCVGCKRSGAFKSVKNTNFFLNHNATEYLESLAKKNGFEVDVGVGGSGGTLIGPDKSKEFQVSIKGDKSTRNTILQEYMDYIEDQLIKDSVQIHGRSKIGYISRFEFRYKQSGITGFIRVNSVLDSNGYIQVDVHMYEHE